MNLLLKHVGPRDAEIVRLVAHPDVIEMIRSVRRQYREYITMDLMLELPALRPWPHMPIFARRWEFPPHPWVEYGPSDERWARPIGFGREVDDRETVVAYGIHRMPMPDAEIPAPARRPVAWSIF